MKKAIIYTRGHNQEMQEISCLLCAKDKGYKVLFVTTNIEDVNGCDVLLVSSVSRISRDRLEYEIIQNKLKSKGIKIESVIEQENATDIISFAVDLLQ